MSYDFVVLGRRPPDWRVLRDALALPDLVGFPEKDGDRAWPESGLRLYRDGISTRTTDVTIEEGGHLRIVIRVLASLEDCELSLRVAESAARLMGVGTVETDYFGAVKLGELRRLHNADWLHERSVSGTRSLAALIADGRGPIATPGPRRPCWFGTRLLGELERAGPPDALAERVLATLRRVQWDIPPSFRDAGVFASGGAEEGGGAREIRFAVWLPGEDLLIPRVDYVALRVISGEIVMVPFAAVAGLAGARAQLLDECQLLIPAIAGDDWPAIVARARPLAVTPRRTG